MQFLQELSPPQQAALGGAIVLLLVLLLVIARKRRAGAAPPEGGKRRARRRDRAAATHLPRRKRRKLAAEAAQAIGATEAAQAPPVPDVPVAAAPEVPVVQAAAAPVEAPQPVDAAVPAPVEAVVADVPAPPVVPPAPVVAAPAAIVPDDPYVQPANPASNPFVAQPGWPAPGELASSFDPDAFDPVPETETLYEEVGQYDDAPAATYVDYADQTEAFQMPAADSTDVSPANEWDVSDTNWADEDEEDVWEVPDLDDDDPVVVDEPVLAEAADTWNDETALESWEADDATPTVVWDETEEAPEAAILEPQAPETETFAFQADDDTRSWDAAAAGSWSAEAPVSADVPAEPSTFSLPTASQPGTSSPVVLDLAGLAASGQSLELVIEPNADGNGVRLRIGAPRPAADPVAAAEDAVVGEPAADGPADTVWADVDSVEAAAEATAEAASWVGHDDPVELDNDDSDTGDSFDAVAETEGELSDDDPAKILADIRARLAALDAAR